MPAQNLTSAAKICSADRGLQPIGLWNLASLRFLPELGVQRI